MGSKDDILFQEIKEDVINDLGYDEDDLDDDSIEDEVNTETKFRFILATGREYYL